MSISRSEVAAVSLDRQRFDRKLVLLGVDGTALMAAFAFVLGVNGQRNEFDLEAQFHPVRLLVDLALGAGLLTGFRSLGHYEERRPFWQETCEVVIGFAFFYCLRLLFFSS